MKKKKTTTKRAHSLCKSCANKRVSKQMMTDLIVAQNKLGEAVKSKKKNKKKSCYRCDNASDKLLLLPQIGSSWYQQLATVSNVVVVTATHHTLCCCLLILLRKIFVIFYIKYVNK